MNAAEAMAMHPVEVALVRAQSEGLRANLGRSIRFLGHREGDVVELQVLDALTGRMRSAQVAHADSFPTALRLVSKAETFDCSGVYLIGNRLDPAVATRAGCGQWITSLKGSSTTDRDITARTMLFVDFDAPRPKGTSATDAQVRATAGVASRVFDKFSSILEGDEPLAYGHSGNGRSLYVALDALAEGQAAPLVRGILAAVKALYGTREVEVDTSVCDAKRLVPCFGTVKRKGISGVLERPHRRTALVCSGSVRRIGLGELEMLVETLRAECDDHGRAEVDKAMGRKVRTSPSSTSTSPGVSSSSAASPFDRARQVSIHDVLAWEGLLDSDRPVCPGCDISDGSSVAIVGNGLKCSHARCASKGYAKGFRTTVDVVAEHRNVSAVEAVKLMAQRFGFEGFAEANAKTETTGEASPSRQGLSPEDVIARWRAHGPIERLPTGWPSFDAASRGGLIFGHCTYLLGAPNAKKTAAEAVLADRWTREGVAVGALLVDETPEDFLIRFAVMAGFSLDDCERRSPEVLERIEAAISGLPLRLYGYDWTIETAAADFRTFVQAGKFERGAFLIDTVQTVSSDAGLAADNPRAVVNANVKALQALATSTRWAVLASSEMNRSAYRSEDAAERTNDMAAGKESGAIEYAAKAQLVFRSVKGNEKLVQVRAPKIKRGASDDTEFHLSFDRQAHTLTECAPPAQAADDSEDRARAKTASRVKADAKVLRDVILRHQGIGEVDLRAELRRQGHAWGVERINAAKRELGAGLENRGLNSRDVRWFVVSAREVRGDD
jgi:hypothetical protein